MKLERRIELLERENAELKRQLEIRRNTANKIDASIRSIDIEKFVIASRILLEKIDLQKPNSILISYIPNERTNVKINS